MHFTLPVGRTELDKSSIHITKLFIIGVIFILQEKSPVCLSILFKAHCYVAKYPSDHVQMMTNCMRCFLKFLFVSRYCGAFTMDVITGTALGILVNSQHDLQNKFVSNAKIIFDTRRDRTNFIQQLLS